MSHTLVQALETIDMVIIDDLYAFEFTLADEGLTVLCMDGRTERRWRFSREQVAAAIFLAESDCWKIHGAEGEHRLRLLEAFSADEDDQDAGE